MTTQPPHSTTTASSWTRRLAVASVFALMSTFASAAPAFAGEGEGEGEDESPLSEFVTSGDVSLCNEAGVEIRFLDDTVYYSSNGNWIQVDRDHELFLGFTGAFQATSVVFDTDSLGIALEINGGVPSSINLIQGKVTYPIPPPSDISTYVFTAVAPRAPDQSKEQWIGEVNAPTKAKITITSLDSCPPPPLSGNE